MFNILMYSNFDYIWYLGLHKKLSSEFGNLVINLTYNGLEGKETYYLLKSQMITYVFVPAKYSCSLCDSV